MEKERKHIDGYPQCIALGEKATIKINYNCLKITSPVVSIGAFYSCKDQLFIDFETGNSIYSLKILSLEELQKKDEEELERLCQKNSPNPEPEQEPEQEKEMTWEELVDDLIVVQGLEQSVANAIDEEVIIKTRCEKCGGPNVPVAFRNYEQKRYLVYAVCVKCRNYVEV